jgi:phosphoglycerate dehydrogenase-like enzyme
VKIVILDDFNHFYETRPGLAELKKRGQVAIYYDNAATVDELAERVKGATVVGANRERTRFPADVLERLTDVELISQSGGAARHIDIDAATRLGIAIAEAPGGGGGSPVSELGLGLLLALARDIPRNDQRVRRGDWSAPVTDPLFGKTLGVIGLGRIGSQMAKVCQVIGMKTIAWGPTLTPERAAANNVEYVSFDELFPRADVLFLSPILSDLTRGIVGREQLAAMKPTSYLINISRGPIVQEDALIEALQQRNIAGAGLDVYHQEPLPVDHPLTKLDNVILTPHVGWVSTNHFTRFADGVIANAINYLDGNPTQLANPDALKVSRGNRKV